MCVLMPTQVLVLVLVLGHQVLVLGHQVLVLVLVLKSQVLDNNTAEGSRDSSVRKKNKKAVLSQR